MVLLLTEWNFLIPGRAFRAILRTTFAKTSYWLSKAKAIENLQRKSTPLQKTLVSVSCVQILRYVWLSKTALRLK